MIRKMLCGSLFVSMFVPQLSLAKSTSTIVDELCDIDEYKCVVVESCASGDVCLSDIDGTIYRYYKRSDDEKFYKLNFTIDKESCEERNITTIGVSHGDDDAVINCPSELSLNVETYDGDEILIVLYSSGRVHSNLAYDSKIIQVDEDLLSGKSLKLSF